MIDLDDAKEKLAELNQSFKEQQERAREEDVEPPAVSEIEAALDALQTALAGSEFDEDQFDELADAAEALIEKFEEKVDDLCEEDDIDEEAHAALLKLQQDTDAGMAGTLEELLAKSDPELIAPFEGVGVPEWAEAAAVITLAVPDEKSQAEALATINMDMAKYNRVQDHFAARMQGDTTFQLSMIYGKAFSEAQANLASAVAPTGESGVSIEKYAEVNAAMSAWSAGGEDVNALLQSEFGYTAATWSQEQMQWTKKLQADPALFKQIEKLDKVFRVKYESADMDDDLSL